MNTLVDGDDGKFHPNGSFLGLDERYHPAGAFLGTDGRYHIATNSQLLKGTKMPNVKIAVARHPYKYNMPIPLHTKLLSLQEKQGIHFSEFISRSIALALVKYDETGNLPPAWRG